MWLKGRVRTAVMGNCEACMVGVISCRIPRSEMVLVATCPEAFIGRMSASNSNVADDGERMMSEGFAKKEIVIQERPYIVGLECDFSFCFE